MAVPADRVDHRVVAAAVAVVQVDRRLDVVDPRAAVDMAQTAVVVVAAADAVVHRDWTLVGQDIVGLVVHRSVRQRPDAETYCWRVAVAAAAVVVGLVDRALDRIVRDIVDEVNSCLCVYGWMWTWCLFLFWFGLRRNAGEVTTTTTTTRTIITLMRRWWNGIQKEVHET